MWLFSDTWWMRLSCFNMVVAGLRCNGASFRARTACGRAAGYVAAAALWLVAACGCCLALLLPLTMLLGVLAAVLLPSFLRCVQRYLHGLLRHGVLLLEFVQRVPYYCKIYQQSNDDIILLGRSQELFFFLFVWVVSLSHTIVIELFSSRFCFHNS